MQHCARDSFRGPPVFARNQSNYGKPVPDLAALTDHKDIQSLTHIEDSVEDSRTADLAWLPQQDQD